MAKSQEKGTKNSARLYYELQEIGRPNLNDVVSRFVKEVNL